MAHLLPQGVLIRQYMYGKLTLVNIITPTKVIPLLLTQFLGHLMGDTLHQEVKIRLYRCLRLTLESLLSRTLDINLGFPRWHIHLTGTISHQVEIRLYRYLS